jgi:hypothetical protein
MISLYSDNIDELPLGSDDSDLEAAGPTSRRGRPVAKAKGKQAVAGKDTGQNAGNTKRKRPSGEKSHSVFAERKHGKGFGNDYIDDDDDVIFIDEIPAVRHARSERRKDSGDGAVQVLDENEDETLRRIRETVKTALGAATAIDEEDIALEVRLESARSCAPAASSRVGAVPSQKLPNHLQEKSVPVKTASASEIGAGVILLRFRFRSDGRIEKVRIRRSDGIVAKVAGPLCAKSSLNVERVKFILDGNILSLEETADDLDLSDESLVEVDDAFEKADSAEFRDHRGVAIAGATVVLKVRFAIGNVLKPIAVRIRRSDPILKMRESVCKRANQDPRRIVFFLDGEAISDADTPDSLDVDDGTLIDAATSVGKT